MPPEPAPIAEPSRRPNARVTGRIMFGCLLIFFAGGATAWLIPVDLLRGLAPLAGFCGKLLVAASFAEVSSQ